MDFQYKRKIRIAFYVVNSWDSETFYAEIEINLMIY